MVERYPMLTPLLQQYSHWRVVTQQLLEGPGPAAWLLKSEIGDGLWLNIVTDPLKPNIS